MMSKNERAGRGGDDTVPSAAKAVAGPPVADSTDWLRVTLSCIGDGVITTDRNGRVTFLNPVAEALTGWTQEDVAADGGVAIELVFNIVNEETRAKVESPTVQALREGVIVGLVNHTILISKNGTEFPISDSAAPIRNASGETAGAVLIFRDVTEQKRQERTVREAKEYAENILESQREAFLVLDTDLRVISANRSFYKEFRVKPGETEGRLVYELGNGQWDIPTLRELLEEILPKNGHKVERFEVEHEFEMIGQRVISLNARRIKRPGHPSELILLGIEDITERNKSQEALRDSHARFETLFDTSPVGMYLVDEQFRLRKMSSKTRAAFGDIAGLIGRDFAEVVHILWPPTAADEIVARFRHTLATGEPYKQSELSEVRYDRKVREYYDWELHRIAQPDGQYGVVCYFLDISAQILAQQAVRESETRYRRLFETAKDGILILDAQTGKITAANAFMCNLTGMGADEFLGKELYEIGMFKDIEENKAAFRDLQLTKYFRHDHLPLHNQHGERVEVEFVANLYSEGERLVAQCNIRDISERSRLERELAAQAEALTMQARSKDEFLAMLSHELRNPLAPIRAAAHIMRLQERGSGVPVNPVLQQVREVIERQVANLTKMVSDLSEVSRVINGRIRLEMQPVDLKQAIGHAIQTVSPLFDQRKHAVSVSLCAESVWAMADPVRLEEVLVNVLNNAAKYTADGGRVEASCEHLRDGGMTYAVLRVRDNGVGIEEALLPRVFDLFTQADRSLDRSSGGLGIGLSLAKRLVALHHGTIWAHSDGPGKGSEFTVKLPLIPSPLSAAASEKLPAVDVTIRPDDDRSGRAKSTAVRVLVVDDNVDLVTMLCSALRYRGFIVQCAYTGPDGLRIARQWQPDIALLDIGLPGLDGYEIARRLRAEQVLTVTTDEHTGTTKAGPRMKLIAVTGYGRDDDIAHAREAGFDGHMVKPCDLEKLEQMMAAPALNL